MGHLTLKVGSPAVDVLLDENDRICGHIKQGKQFEPNTLMVFSEWARKGGLLLDVGCYSGLFSFAAIKLGMSAIGFEPYPPNQAQIEKNMGLNGITFPLHKAAVTDRVGIARLGYNEKVKLTAGASLDRKSGPGMTVPVVSIDSLKVAPAIIKIDVEGHEAGVLRGAKDTIAEHQPLLIVEALDDDHRKAVIDLLPRYRLEATLDVRNLILVPDK